LRKNIRTKRFIQIGKREKEEKGQDSDMKIDKQREGKREKKERKRKIHTSDRFSSGCLSRGFRSGGRLIETRKYK
jgi:hypothetical protein